VSTVTAVDTQSAERHPNSKRFHQLLQELGQLHDQLPEDDYGMITACLLIQTAHEIAKDAADASRLRSSGSRTEEPVGDITAAKNATDGTSETGSQRTRTNGEPLSNATARSMKRDSDATASLSKSTMIASDGSTTSVRSVENQIGGDPYTLTTITRGMCSGIFSVVNAIRPSASCETIQIVLSGPLGTFEGGRRLYQLLAEIALLSASKQSDYGRGDDPFFNVRQSGVDWDIPPWVAAMIRGTDKVRRLQSLRRKGSLANESASDSLKDLAVYALIALVLMEDDGA
jgi:hypothetical protein